MVTTNATLMLSARHSSAQASSVITITGIGDHDQPDWLITMTGIRNLCQEIAERWSVNVCEQTMGKWLRRLDMTRLQPRPYHPKKDPEAEATFKKTSAAW